MTLLTIFAQESTQFHADNSWLPESAEILWGTIAFVVIVGLLWKFAAKPIGAAMRGRTNRIRDEIEAAAKARTDAEADVAQIRRNLADVDAERARILAEAAENAARLRADGVERNDAEAAAVEARAEADIASMGGRATSELQAQVATWSAEATERIVLGQLDDATLGQLVEDAIARIGAAQ